MFDNMNEDALGGLQLMAKQMLEAGFPISVSEANDNHEEVRFGIQANALGVRFDVFQPSQGTVICSNLSPAEARVIRDILNDALDADV